MNKEIKHTEEIFKLLKEGLLHGIEVVNDKTYSAEALQIAIDHNLAVMGTSDIHGLVDWRYDVPKGGHRPVTLVFAEKKTERALKEALENRRTVVWFDNTLIGSSKYLVPLIQESLNVKDIEIFIEDEEEDEEEKILVYLVEIEAPTSHPYYLPFYFTPSQLGAVNPLSSKLTPTGRRVKNPTGRKV